MYSLHSQFSLYSSALFRLGMLWVMALSLPACRKDKDNTPPVIRLDSPVLGALFYFNNAITIEGSVTDESNLESVQIEITNAQGQRFLETVSFYPDGNTYTINYSIAHNDLYLISGTYYVKITAKDGENQQILFREIQLIEAPRTLEKIFVVRNTGGTTAIDTTASNTPLSCITYPEEYRFGGIDSRTNQLVACGASTSSLLSLSYPDFQPINAAFPPVAEAVTAFLHEKSTHEFYWGTQEGNIWKTTTQGTQLLATLASPVTQIATNSSHLIAITEGTTSSYVQVLRIDNGIIETALTLDWEIRGVVHIPADTERMLLIGNQASIAHFAWLNLTTSAINEVFNFYETSPVLSVCATSGNDFYVVHNLGIAHYQNALNNYTLSSGTSASKLVYDDLNETLWAISNDEIRVLDESAQSVLQTIPAIGVQDIWIKYTK